MRVRPGRKERQAGRAVTNRIKYHFPGGDSSPICGKMQARVNRPVESRAGRNASQGSGPPGRQPRSLQAVGNGSGDPLSPAIEALCRDIGLRMSEKGLFGDDCHRNAPAGRLNCGFEFITPPFTGGPGSAFLFSPRVLMPKCGIVPTQATRFPERETRGYEGTRGMASALQPSRGCRAGAGARREPKDQRGQGVRGSRARAARALLSLSLISSMTSGSRGRATARKRVKSAGSRVCAWVPGRRAGSWEL